MKNTRNYQFMWGRPFVFAFARMTGSIGLIYRWVLCIGWLEIRRWAKPRERGRL